MPAVAASARGRGRAAERVVRQGGRARSTRSWSSCSAPAAQGPGPYGTGILVSPDGYILTVNSHILDTQDLRVHLYDGTPLPRQGRRHRAGTGRRPHQDRNDKDKVEDLPYFDVVEAAKRPLAEPGTGCWRFSNQFQIATRDEPMSVQHGVVAAYAKLYGRIGIFEAPYTGNVYVLDAITNNPGAPAAS